MRLFSDKDYQHGTSWQTHTFKDDTFDCMTTTEDEFESQFIAKKAIRNRKKSVGERFTRRNNIAVNDMRRLTQLHRDNRKHTVSPLVNSMDIINAGQAQRIIQDNSSESLVGCTQHLSLIHLKSVYLSANQL